MTTAASDEPRKFQLAWIGQVSELISAAGLLEFDCPAGRVQMINVDLHPPPAQKGLEPVGIIARQD
jgi:hypothetical protein